MSAGFRIISSNSCIAALRSSSLAMLQWLCRNTSLIINRSTAVHVSNFFSPSYIIHEIFKMLVVFLTIISIATGVQAVAFRLPVNTFEIPGSHVSQNIW